MSQVAFNPPTRPIRVENPRQLAEIVVRMLRSQGVSVPDEAIPHIEREVAAELEKIEVAMKVSGMVNARVLPTFDHIQGYLGRILENGAAGFAGG